MGEPGAMLSTNQVHGQDMNISDDNNAHTITINSVSNYSVDVYTGNALVSFFVDTGAAVSLVHGDIWDSIKLLAACNIDSSGWYSPSSERSVKAKLSLLGQKFDHKLVIAESLTSQGILGLDFLEANHCILSLATGELLMHGKSIPLQPQNTREPKIMQIEVAMNKTCTVEANSEMELMGKMPLTCEGTWMIEGNQYK